MFGHMSQLLSLGVALVLAVLVVVGDITAVTVWFPHVGSHHHAPSTLGYVALYSVLVLLNGYAWAFIVAGPVSALQR